MSVIYPWCSNLPRSDIRYERNIISKYFYDKTVRFHAVFIVYVHERVASPCHGHESVKLLSTKIPPCHSVLGFTARQSRSEDVTGFFDVSE